jgi:hypothetical protein
MQNAARNAPLFREGWLVWEVPGKPVSVRLSADVVGHLGMAVREGFKAHPWRGLETGGLLIGSRREVGNQVVVCIDDFEPVESEHAAGPSYLLSNADRGLLEARIAARAAARNTSIVGFYRSHTRRNFAITVEDAALFSTYFRKASDVFLLIRSTDDGPPKGGFIIREGGKILSSSPYAQFSLDRASVTPAAPEMPVPATEKSQEPPQAAQADPPPAPRRANPFGRWPMWLAAASGVVLAVGLPFVIQTHIPASIPAKPVPSLALKVTNTGNGLRLSWDHQAARHAGHAVLWIKDGQEEQKVEIDSKELSEGSVVYWPRNSDVSFRLEVLSQGVRVTESVWAIGVAPKPPVVDSAPPPVAVEPPTGPPVEAAAEAAVEPSPSPVFSPNANRTGTASRQLSHAFALPNPQADPATLAPAALPDPPQIQPVAALAPERGKEFLKPIETADRLGPGEAADSSFRVNVEQMSGSRLEQFAKNIPLIGKRYRRSNYVPPVPLRKPALTDLSHRNVARDVDVYVKVYVNPSGKVDYSEALSKVADTDRDLQTLAVFSARRWEFAPARAGDDTVPGEVILHYQFGPGARVAGNQDSGAH